MVRNVRLLHTESSNGLGGQEFRTLHECLGMKARGHQVYVAAQPSSALFHKAQSAGLYVFPVPMPKVQWVGLIATFLNLIKRFDIHIVNTHGSIDSWAGGIAARLASTRPLLIRTRHKSTAVTPGLRHAVLYRYLPHAVITTGERIRQDLISRNGLPEGQVTSIPTGVDLTVFFPREADLSLKHTLSIPLDHRVVGTVAFLRDYKGIEGFLSAARMVLDDCRQVHFVIVGDGPQRSALEQLATQLNIHDRVSFLGFREDVPGLLSFFDVFVLNSVTGEGVPQVLAQALAMVRPVVATNVGSVPEIVRHGETGILIHPSDPEALASAINDLLTDEAMRTTMARAGRDLVVQQYSLQDMLNKTERLYDGLRGRHG